MCVQFCVPTRPTCSTASGGWASVLVELLAIRTAHQVGFDLKIGIAGHIYAKLGVNLGGRTSMLNTVLQHGRLPQNHDGRPGRGGDCLNQRFRKPRKVTTLQLVATSAHPAALLYAANDAYAALKVLEFSSPSRDLPIIAGSASA